MTAQLYFHGQHVELASEAEITAGLQAAAKVFAANEADPAACLAALTKMKADELLSREEALLCVIWDEAEEAAFRAATLGWLSRDVDIRLGVN